MSYTKKDVQKTRQRINTGEVVSTYELSALKTSETIVLAGAMSKCSVQSTGDLAGNILFSVDGVHFVSTTAFTAGTVVSFSTHNFAAVRVDRTSGTGRLVIAATA